MYPFVSESLQFIEVVPVFLTKDKMTEMVPRLPITNLGTPTFSRRPKSHSTLHPSLHDLRPSPKDLTPSPKFRTPLTWD